MKGKCSICKSLCKNKLYFYSLTLKFQLDVTVKPSVLSPAMIFHVSENKKTFKSLKKGEKGEEGGICTSKSSLLSFTLYYLEIPFIEIQYVHVMVF